MSRPTASPEQLVTRFWKKVDKSAECWTWTASLDRNGYGLFWAKGRFRRAHRMAWIYVRGPIPAGMYVCHRCDNPSCVNLAHLFLGSPADNTSDAVAKGRLATGDRNGSRLHPERLARGERQGAYTHPESRRRGEVHGNAKLTEVDVIGIRAARAAGVSPAVLASRHGVVESTIRRVASGAAWAHVSNEVAR